MATRSSVVFPVLWHRSAATALFFAAASCAVHHAPEPQGDPDGPPVVEAHLGLRSLAAVQAPATADSSEVDWIVELNAASARTAIGTAGLPLGCLDGCTVLRTFAHLDALAVRATPDAVERLRRDPSVLSVTPDRLLRTQAAAGDVVGASKARATMGLAGASVRIAVVDTGADAGHPDLAGRIVAQQCFSASGCPGGGKQGPSAADAHGHGSHVASTLVGAGKLAPAGIAPEAKMVAVRVFGKDGTGPTSDLLAGLNWLIGQVAVHKIRVLNLSLGSGDLFAGTCDALDPVTAKALKILRSKGVVTFAAAGNDAAQGKLATPACLTAAVPVGATYAASYGGQAFGKLCKDSTTSTAKVACFSNRAPQLTLVAPGAFLTGAVPGNKVASLAGTSQATPVAAVVAALMLGCNPGLSASQVVGLLSSTSKPLIDKLSGQKFGLVQAAAAGKAACPWLGPAAPGKP